MRLSEMLVPEPLAVPEGIHLQHGIQIVMVMFSMRI
jgi:hypothetical protein